MSQLVNLLRKFNRKERYWLLHNTLKNDSMNLCGDFRKNLENEIGIFIPEDAWWAMDYHLDWLVGVLHLYNDGIEDQPYRKYKDLIQGTQQDIDMVISFSNTIILIEAKGDTSWSNDQLSRKIDRLEAILNISKKVEFKFVLMSLVQRPPNIKRINIDKPINVADWPKWMLNENNIPSWIELKMSHPEHVDGFFKVVRCIEQEKLKENKKNWKASENGDHWVVKPIINIGSNK